MTRVKTSVASRKRRKKILSIAKGYRGGRSKLYRVAKQEVARALNYAYRDRRARKREFRRLWILRINAATREHGLSYSSFMNGLRRAELGVDRKMLSNLAVNDPQAFAELVNIAKEKLSA